MKEIVDDHQNLDKLQFLKILFIKNYRFIGPDSVAIIHSLFARGLFDNIQLDKEQTRTIIGSGDSFMVEKLVIMWISVDGIKFINRCTNFFNDGDDVRFKYIMCAIDYQHYEIADELFSGAVSNELFSGAEEESQKLSRKYL